MKKTIWVTALLLVSAAPVLAEDSHVVERTRTTTVTEPAAPAFGGYDVTTYEKQTLTKGSPEYKSEYQGKTYYFSSSDAKRSFESDPSRYSPAFDGYSALELSKGERVPGNYQYYWYSKKDHRPYFFSSEAAKDQFEKNADENLVSATKHFTSQTTTTTRKLEPDGSVSESWHTETHRTGAN